MSSSGDSDEVRRLASEVDHLKEALGSRTVIGEALGILMERHTLDEDAAFAALRRASQTTNTKLAELAVKLVATGELPELL